MASRSASTSAAGGRAAAAGSGTSAINSLKHMTGKGAANGTGGNAAGDADDRHPNDIALEQTAAQIKDLERQLKQFIEGIADIQNATAKIKQCEQDIAAKEHEAKSQGPMNVKWAELAVALRGRSGAVLDLRADATGELDFGEIRAASPLITTVSASAANGNASLLMNSSTAQPPATPSAAAAANAAASTAGRKRYGINAATTLTDAQRDDAADREILRGLAQVVRERLTPVVLDSLAREYTKRERAADEIVDWQLAHPATSAAAAAATPVPPATGRGSKAPSGGAGGRAAKNAPPPQPAADVPQPPPPLPNRVDIDTHLPPGFDPEAFTELLRTRANRLHDERSLRLMRKQLEAAHATVLRRKAERATKAAVKRVEKQLAALGATLRELQREKDERDMKRRVEAAAAVAATAVASTPSTKDRKGQRPRQS